MRRLAIYDGASVVEFTDPETLLTYRAPCVEPQVPQNANLEFPTYYGDQCYRNTECSGLDDAKFHNWALGCDLLIDAQQHVDGPYSTAKLQCETAIADAIANPEPGETDADAELRARGGAECTFGSVEDESILGFEKQRKIHNEHIGFIDNLRKWNRWFEGF